MASVAEGVHSAHAAEDVGNDSLLESETDFKRDALYCASLFFMDSSVRDRRRFRVLAFKDTNRSYRMASILEEVMFSGSCDIAAEGCCDSHRF